MFEQFNQCQGGAEAAGVHHGAALPIGKVRIARDQFRCQIVGIVHDRPDYRAGRHSMGLVLILVVLRNRELSAAIRHQIDEFVIALVDQRQGRIGSIGGTAAGGVHVGPMHEQRERHRPPLAGAQRRAQQRRMGVHGIRIGAMSQQLLGNAEFVATGRRDQCRIQGRRTHAPSEERIHIVHIALLDGNHDRRGPGSFGICDSPMSQEQACKLHIAFESRRVKERRQGRRRCGRGQALIGIRAGSRRKRRISIAQSHWRRDAARLSNSAARGWRRSRWPARGRHRRRAAPG